MAEGLPLRLEVRRPRVKSPHETDRFGYQSRHVSFDIQPGDRVLDIGSGGYPFFHASVLVDRFPKASPHRYEPLVRQGKPLVVADIDRLPFEDKCFDFVYCSHLLEHVDHPVQACAEIMRVGRRGYIETPTMGKDVLFAWTAGVRHKWHVVSRGRHLCFFEYSVRELVGIRSSAWRDLIFDKWEHPLQVAFSENQDVFNVMFPWCDSFAIFVFRLDGSVETLNAEVTLRNALPHR
jgi:SAM-dependent methyltransferase